MEAKDLRIGNIVWLKSKQKEYTIESGYEIDTGIESNDFDPIRLNAEYLVRLGFELSLANAFFYSYILELGRGRVISVSNAGTPNEIITISETDRDQRKVVDLVVLRNYDYDGYTSVDQLQNLCFSINKKELTIKE